MTAAYILAGELATSQGRPLEAFRRYLERLRPFTHAKQQAAERFAAASSRGPGAGFSSAIR